MHPPDIHASRVNTDERPRLMSATHEPTPSDPSESGEREEEQEASRPPGAHGKKGQDSDGRSEPYEEEPESPMPAR